MSGREVACGAMRVLGDVRYAHSVRMSSARIAYDATRETRYSVALPAYALAMPCPVLAYALAMPCPVRAYGVRGCSPTHLTPAMLLLGGGGANVQTLHKRTG
eukprot:3354376-Rhodomonas_salina.1